MVLLEADYLSCVMSKGLDGSTAKLQKEHRIFYIITCFVYLLGTKCCENNAHVHDAHLGIGSEADTVHFVVLW